MFKISGIILAKNEEKKIIDAIKTLSFCDEIIVGDDMSTDQTRKKAIEAGAKVYEVMMNGDFSKVRNDLMKKAKNQWVLYIDADEKLSDALMKEIQSLKLDSFDCYRLRRCDIFLGKKLRYGEVKKVYEKGIIRLVKKGSGEWRGMAHEEFVPVRFSRVAVLREILYHNAHDSVSSFLSSINEYSTIRAKELVSSGKKISLLELIAYPIGKFLSSYFLHSGYRDGSEGFIYSFMMAFHSFLVRGKAILSAYDNA